MLKAVGGAAAIWRAALDIVLLTKHHVSRINLGFVFMRASAAELIGGEELVHCLAVDGGACMRQARNRLM
jgi:hypothetical protein